MMPPRESSKHGPLLDEQMAHETEGLVRGGRTTHAEEWKETEPTEPVPHRHAEAPGQPTASRGDDVELRSALARALTRSAFPADREEIVAHLERTSAEQELIDEATRLPGERRYANVGEVARALGLVTETGAIETGTTKAGEQR
jgi:Protein of unknown function (DUF2795)